MLGRLNSGEITLADNQPFSLRHGRGRSIVCTGGTIWITVAGNPEDIFLRCGERHEIRRNGLVIVESIGNGRIHIEQRCRASVWQRLFGWSVLAHPGKKARRLAIACLPF